MQRALNAANGRANVPVAIPEDKSDQAQDLTAVPATFVAPPRTINDVRALLDGEKPDASRIEQLKAAAEKTPPTGGSRRDLAWFYYTRGNARGQLGRLNEAIADANKAIEVARGGVDAEFMGRLQQFAGAQYLAAGNLRQALTVLSGRVRDTNVRGARGMMFDASLIISTILIKMGDLEQADAYLRRNLALIQEFRTSGFPARRAAYATRGQGWEAIVEQNRAVLFEARGQFREAESAYRLGELRLRAWIKDVLSHKLPSAPLSDLLQGADSIVLSQARMKARQGLLAEAEVDARRALLARLKDLGKYHPSTPNFLTGLADILIEQGRFGEAEQLVRVAIEINRAVGVAEDSQGTARVLSELGRILILQDKVSDAATVYAELDAAIANWEPQRRQVFELDGSRVESLYASGQIEAGIVIAQTLLERQISRFGEKYFSTAAARGSLALGYMLAGKTADAVSEFKASIPILMAAARENADDDDTTIVAARSQLLQRIVEAYISLLARGQKDTGGDIAVETFRLADAVRGHTVQQAVAAASARMSAKDPALAALIRTEQDLSKQIRAQLGVLSNTLALSSGERDEQGVKAINASIERARTDRNKTRAEIVRLFPNYSDLVDPKPPTVESIKDTLHQGEAILSFYFGRSASFVWAVSKDGPIAFASIGATAGEIQSKVAKLREPLDQPSYSSKFDFALAYELYSLLLKPVETVWKPAKNLIVVTNGALGRLPISLLPTEPTKLSPSDQPLFAKYRQVAWLARSYTVTMIPSSAALRALRQLPPGSDKREPLIGFGDPFFSAEQAQEVQRHDGDHVEVASVVQESGSIRRRASPETRGIDSADLSRLPRLPETAEELKAIALALNLDPSKVLHLGKDANVKVVKDTDLSRFRIIAFSTHGLLPGDLDGLTQPALALTAPSVAEVDGDALLTMEDILRLKLDADWVVLSACNTAAGEGAGAEAASGLGRAFFYAGSRSLLVTNWSVDSASARDLVTDIFRRQAENATLSRAEALRQAMMALMDGPGYVENGATLFTYAHPFFWAPYSLIGDGGN
jgi:CHAT domain-containing protein